MDPDLLALTKEKRAKLSEMLRSLGLQGEEARANAAYRSGGSATSDQRDIAAAQAEAEARGVSATEAEYGMKEEAIKRAKAQRKAQNIQNWTSTILGGVGAAVGVFGGPAGVAGGAALGSGVGKMLGTLLGGSEADLDPTALNDLLSGVTSLTAPSLEQILTKQRDAYKKVLGIDLGDLMQRQPSAEGFMNYLQHFDNMQNGQQQDWDKILAIPEKG